MAGPIDPNQQLAQDVALLENARQLGNAAMDTISISRQRGNDLTAKNAVMDDFNRMLPSQFAEKYAPSTVNAVQDISQNTADLLQEQAQTRDGWTMAGDNAINIGSGAIQGIGGIAAFGLGAVNRDAGLAASTALSTFKKWGEGFQSNVQQRARELDGIRSSLDAQDNERRFAEDRADDKGLVDTLASYGKAVLRDASAGAGRLFEDPAMLTTGIAEGVGSLLAGGPVSKAIGVASGLGRGAGVAGAWGSKANMPAAIGLLEGGSAYTQTAQEVLEMSEEDLLDNSPQYQEAIINGVSPDEARKQVANRAGLIAGAIQAPLAMASGRIVAGQEANPAQWLKFGDFVKNVLRETTEEGIQSFTGEIAGNIGIQLTADENKNLVEGVGAALAQGAILGAGTTGVLQGPQAAARIPMDALKAGAGAVMARGEKIVAQAQKSEGADDATISEAIQTAPQVAEELASELERSVDTSTPAQAPTPSSSGSPQGQFASRIREAVNVSPEMIAGLGPSLAEKLPRAATGNDYSNRIELIQDIAKMAVSGTNDEATHVQAGMFLLSEMQRQESVFGSDAEAVLRDAQNEPGLLILKSYRDLMALVSENPSTKQAMEWATEDMQLAEETAKNLSDEALGTKEGQQAVATTLKAAEVRPDIISENVANQMLYQDRNGRLRLSGAERQVLGVVQRLAEAGRTLEENIQDIKSADISNNTDVVTVSPHLSASESVSAQILFQGGRKAHQFSLGHHAQRINQAVLAQNPDEVRRTVQGLRRFALHMGHKIKAWNTSYETGKPEAYQTLGPDGDWLATPNYLKVQFHQGQDGSLNLARRTEVDAVAVTTFANQIIAQFPELGMKPLNVPKLRDEYRGTGTKKSEVVAAPAREMKTQEPPVTTTTPQQPAVRQDTGDLAKVEGDIVVQPKLENKSQEQDGAPTPGTEASTDGAPSQPQVSVIEDNGLSGPKDPEKTEAAAERFPSLVRAKQAAKPLFEKTYKFGKEFRSRLMRSAAPLREMYVALDDAETTIDFIGGDTKFDVLPLERQALKELIEVGGVLQQRMMKRLDVYLKDTVNGVSKSQALAEGGRNAEILLNSKEGKVLAVVENENGDFGYNRTLLNVAMMAALNWVAQPFNQTVERSDKEIADLLGIKPYEVDADMRDFFTKGIGLQQAVSGLTQEIKTFWGTSPDLAASLTDVDGIAEGVAKEILSVMENGSVPGFYETDTIKGRNGNEYTQFFFQKINRAERYSDIFARLGAGRKLLTEALGRPDVDDGVSYGEPPKKAETKQLRNPMSQISKRQLRALRNDQKTPYYLNQVNHEFTQGLGLESYLLMFGGQPLADADRNLFNAEHLKAVEGKNLNLEMQFLETANQVRELEAYANAQGVEAASVPKFYRSAYTVVNRLQMLGPNNPQVSKLARHVFMATKSTLNMNEASDRDLFWLSVAQGLGEKTHNQTLQTNVENAQKKITGDYAPLVQELVNWLNARDNGETYNQKKYVDLALALKKPLSEHGHQSLMEVARLQRAAQEELGAFETFAYVEADGITNGAMNALMLFTSGPFTGDWLKTVAKGGYFVGLKAKTMAEHLASLPDKSDERRDLYGTGSKALETILKDRTDAMDPEMQVQWNALLRLMKGLNANIREENGELIIERGVLKNPLTISVYRSGEQGLADKTAKELVNWIYEKFTDEIQGKSNFIGNYNIETMTEDLQVLLGSRMVWDRDRLAWTYRPVKPSAAETLQKAKFSAEELEAFTGKVRHLFVAPMREAINGTVMGYVDANMSLIQRATNAQAIVLKYVFTKTVLHALADRKSNPEKYPDWRPGQMLTGQEIRDIQNGLLGFAAQVHTKDQSWLLGMNENGFLPESVNLTLPGESEPTTVRRGENSRSLTGGFSTPPTLGQPTEIGVAGVPDMVIGSGDGLMITQYLTDNERSLLSTQVYDGINIAVQDLLQGAKVANQAVFGTWQVNPMEALHQSFEAFLRLDPVVSVLDGLTSKDKFTQSFIKDLVRNNEGDAKLEGMSYGMLKNLLKDSMTGLLGELSTSAEDISIRQQVLSETPASIDQMASSPEAFHRTGTLPITDEMTYEEVAQVMETRAQEIRVERGLAAANQKSEDEKLARLLGLADGSEQLRTFSVAGINALRQEISSSLPNHLRSALKAATASLADSDFRIVVGSLEEIQAWEQRNFPETFSRSRRDYEGKIDLVNNIIYVANLDPETLAHELVHAATITKVRAFYAKNGSLPELDKNAVSNLEGLMGEWLSYKFDNEVEAVRQAHDAAMGEVLHHLENGRKAEALNEFMAWSMTNANLIKVAKTIEVRNPILKIALKAIQGIKALLFGSKAKDAGDDLFSNISFNTRVLMAAPTPLELYMSDFADVELYHSSSGSRQSLNTLEAQFREKINGFLKTPTDPAEKLVRKTEAKEALVKAAKVTLALKANGFAMTPQEGYVANLIGAAYATGFELDANAMTRVQEIYTHVMKNLTVSDLVFDANDPMDIALAQDRLDALNGEGVNQVDAKNRSSILPAFLALAQVHDGFRNALRRIKPPKSNLNEEGTLDARLENIGTRTLDSLSMLMSGDRKAKDVASAMDALMDTLVNTVAERRTGIELATAKFADYADNIGKGFLQGIRQKAQERRDAKPSTANKALAIGANMLDSEGIHENSEAMLAFANTDGVWDSARSLVKDLTNRVASNKEIFDMISKSRFLVDQVRQQFREVMPKIISDTFSRKLTDAEHGALFDLFGRGDAGALVEHVGTKDAIRAVTDDAYRRTQIRFLEGEIARFDSKRAGERLAKAQQYATFQVTGEWGQNLLTNAQAVAQLFGSSLFQDSVSPLLVDQLDQLMSLYAIEGFSADERSMVREMGTKEAKGLEYTLNVLAGIRKTELKKPGSELARINHFKGHIRGESLKPGHLVVVSKADEKNWIAKGYTKTGTYTGSNLDLQRGQQSYYYAPLQARSDFKAGIMQTVHDTYSGANPINGFSSDRLVAGRITDPRTVKLISQNIQKQVNGPENLRPIFSGNGEVLAYERTIDPKQLARLSENKHLPTMMGAWRGRQMEERVSREMNTELLGNVFAMWKSATVPERSKFVDISRSKDPIHQRAWANVPIETKRQIRVLFGKGAGFPVRRDLIDDVAGYPMASVGDLWTGGTRWDKEQQEGFRRLAIGFLGKEAYRYLINAEKTLQDTVVDAKVLIVLKSIVVPVANALSVVLQLQMLGVPFRHIVQNGSKKMSELNFFVKQRARENQLDTDLLEAQSRGDTRKVKEIEREIQTIWDSYRSLSLAPLIEAGEFSSISEGDVSREDIALAESRWANLVEKIADKLPEGLQTPYRYALMTRDTATFKLMARATQYSDFLGKAILWDDLIQRQGLSKEEAKMTLAKQFVNYNRLPGRNRQYLESVGLLWFYNFKIRSMTAAQQILTENPFRALMSSVMSPLDMAGTGAGTPVGDNIVSTILDGRAENSLGWGMLFRAPGLHPTGELLFH